MSAASLEDRVCALEAQMAELLHRKPARQKDWRKTIGMFTGDELMWKICQNALDYREEDRRQSLAELDAEQAKKSESV
jgi:hypothetical protein